VAVYTINPSTTNFGAILSTASNYNNARAGSGTLSVFTSSVVAGQYVFASDKGCYETFLSFDTSSVVGTIVSAELQLYADEKQTSEAYDVQARLYDFGTSVTTADWIAGASLSSYTLLASLAGSSHTLNAYNTLGDVALAANINQSGDTRILLCSSDLVDGDPPTTYDYIAYHTPSETNKPKLVITTADSTNGELAKTIAAFTSSATGVRKTNGVLSQSVGGFTATIEGAVGGSGEGVVAQSIGAFTLSATISRTTNAYLESSIGDFGLGATTAVPIAGTLSQSIGSFTLLAQSKEPIEGDLSQSIGSFTLAATSTAALQGALSASIGNFLLVAIESGPAWPSLYDFPQSPLDGTWRRERGDDTLKTEREVGARQYRARNGGNYADVTFAIMVPNKNALDLLDCFFRDDCKNGATPFYWIDPDTGENLAWLWASPPQVRHVALQTYRVECALLKEAA
jgi:hypothetical protein